MFDFIDGDREMFNILCLLSFCGLIGINVEGVIVIVDFFDLNDDMYVDLDVYFFYV